MSQPYFVKKILVIVLLVLGIQVSNSLAQTASGFGNELLFTEFEQDSITP